MHREKSTKTKQINQSIYRSMKPVKCILHRRSVTAIIVQVFKQNYVNLIVHLEIGNTRNLKTLTNCKVMCIDPKFL